MTDQYDIKDAIKVFWRKSLEAYGGLFFCGLGCFLIGMAAGIVIVLVRG